MKIKNLSFNDASELRLSEYNRDIRPEHVADIMSAIVNNFDMIPPLRITQYGVILDGSHTREAFMAAVSKGLISSKTKLPAIVVNIKPEEEKSHIKSANEKHKNYVLTDYIKMNIMDGSESLKILEDWCRTRELCINQMHKTHRIKHAFGAAFLTGKRSDSSMRSGTFMITPEDIKEGTAIYDEVNELRKILDWPVASIRYDYMAQIWRDVRDRHSYEDWKSVFKSQKKTLRDRVPYTIKGFRDMFDAIGMLAGRAPRKKTAKK